MTRSRSNRYAAECTPHPTPNTQHSSYSERSRDSRKASDDGKMDDDAPSGGVLLVRGLTRTLTSAHVAEVLRHYGAVSDVDPPAEDARGQRYTFATFASADEAETAAEHLVAIGGTFPQVRFFLVAYFFIFFPPLRSFFFWGV